MLSCGFEKLTITTELPQVWHFAALLSLSQNDDILVQRMSSKWTPPATEKSISDCETILSDLLNSVSMSPKVEEFLYSVDVKEYAHLTLVWRYNSFGHHTDNNALCMFDVTSMISHSCGASGVWHFGAEDSFCLRARVSLRPGDEISISYLGDEELFKSIPIRREKTMGWLFTCQCTRCDDYSVDFARGFRCKTCVVGSIYFDTSSESASPCDTCNSVMDEETIQRFTDLENQYADRVLGIEKTDTEDMEAVLREAVNLFSDMHWIIHMLEYMLCDAWKSSEPTKPLRIHYMHKRLNFLRTNFPMANYTTAWLLEELSDLHATKSAVIATKFIEQSYWLVRTLCGPDHPFTESVQSKWEKLLSDKPDVEIRE